MELSDSLNAILRSYTQSVRLLTGYLRHIRDAINDIQAQHAQIVAKLDAVASGDSDPSPPSPDEEAYQLDLNAKQLDAIIAIMQDAEGNTAVYPNLTYRMSFVYLVAIFDAFLSDIFTQVAQARPEILTSKNKQVSYAKILELGNFEAMVDFIASRELNELSYKSIGEQAKYYEDRFGVALCESGVSVDELVELRCARNLLVHNNGIVNHIYLEQVSGSGYKSGDEVKVDAEYFDHAVKTFGSIVTFVTAKLIEKHADRPAGESPVHLSES
jgi:hypothetical protein